MTLDAGWRRKCAFTQNHTLLGGDETDFVVPFVWTGSQATSNLPQEMVDADGMYSAKSDGSDVRFTSDSNGETTLAFEVVTFSTDNNPANSRAEIWVKVPSLSSVSDTTIYIWYNNPSATSPGYNGCWDANAAFSYIAVYHMNGSGNIADSGLSGFTLTNSGSSEDTGQLGMCRNFDGAADYAASVSNIGISGNATRSILYWIKRDSTGDVCEVNTGTNVANGRFGTGSLSPHLYSWGYGVGNDYDTAFHVVTGAWNQIVIGHNGTRSRIFLDATQRGSDFTHTYATTNAPLVVGRQVDSVSTRYLNGRIDELWVLSNDVSTTFITSNYNSQNSPQTFWTIGTADGIIFPYGWLYRVMLTQDHTKNTSGVQSNFVSLLAWTGIVGTSCLPEEMFNADGLTPAKSDGSDIRITSDEAGSIQLPFEIVVFTTNNDPSLARAEIYVKVPQVSHLTDINIYVWWGNTAAVAYVVTGTYGRNAVWTDYLMVFHFQSTTLTDSTGNGYSATNTNITTAAGKLIGNAGSFNGSTSHATIPTILSSVGWGGWTSWYVTAWMYHDALNNWSRLFDFSTSVTGNDNVLFANQDTSSTARFDCYNNTAWQGVSSSGAISLSTWAYWGCRFINGTGTTTLKNGEVLNTTTGNSPLRNIDRTSNYLGRSNWVIDAYFDGLIDEFRVRKNYPNYFRQSDYNTNNDPNGYWGVGTVHNPSSDNQRVFDRAFNPAISIGFDRVN